MIMQEIECVGCGAEFRSGVLLDDEDFLCSECFEE